MNKWPEDRSQKLSVTVKPIENKIILLIDDHTDILENLKEFLELEGYKIEIAADGHKGLNLALTHIPDLIVCDVLMPGMNGHEVLHQLLRTPIISSIPFIFSSSFSERLDKAEALAMGADDYFIKPFEPEKLLLTIKSLLKTGSKRKTQELTA